MQLRLPLVELLLRLGLIGSYLVWDSTSADLCVERAVNLSFALMQDSSAANLHRRACVISRLAYFCVFL